MTGASLPAGRQAAPSNPSGRTSTRFARSVQAHMACRDSSMVEQRFCLPAEQEGLPAEQEGLPANAEIAQW